MLQKTYTRSKKNFQTLEISCLHYNNETLPFFEIFFLPQKKPKSVVHPPTESHFHLVTVDKLAVFLDIFT